MQRRGEGIGYSKEVVFYTRTRLPPVTLLAHGIRHLLETSNISTHHQTREGILASLSTKLGSDLISSLEHTLHDTLELIVNLLHGPLQTSRVLSHLETRDGHTTAVGGLAGCVPDAVGSVTGAARGLEYVDGFLGATHVGAFSYETDTGGDESLGFFL
jgi:hypothetical protein